MSGIYAFHDISADDYTQLVALCTEFVWLRDYFHLDKIADLFTEDCSWVPPPDVKYAPTTIVGRKAMGETFGKRSRDVTTRTLINNMRFVMDGPNSARGWVTFTIYAAHKEDFKMPLPQMVGDWIDTYEKGADGRWRIKTKKTEILFGGLRHVKYDWEK